MEENSWGKRKVVSAQNKFDYLFPVMLVGDSYAGKSKLRIRFTDDAYDPPRVLSAHREATRTALRI